LDNEQVFEQFEEIERKIDRLIEVCRSYETTNLELKEKIKNLQEELQGKAEAEKRYAEEKALIRSRVDGLLVRLQDIAETQNSGLDT
jgi:cell division protein ZapB